MARGGGGAVLSTCSFHAPSAISSGRGGNIEASGSQMALQCASGKAVRADSDMICFLLCSICMGRGE